jgi:alkylation response protein AidB-like acyl-CoA dehydrogenase
MVGYKAPLRDYQFLFHEVFDGCGETAGLGYDVEPDFVDSIVSGWAEFVQGVWAPTNRIGDEEGCRFEDGRVTVPEAFRDAWRQTVEAGWLALPCDPKYGGEGLPLFVRNALDEIAISGNMALSTFGALCSGVYDLIHEHGTESLRNLYLERLGTGEWCGTMALTEPHCGTDLGILRSRAEPLGDGRYAVNGTKMFITAGEHDLAENIVHMVLARLPDAPEGTRGISLFLVPKFLPDESGGIGELNAVSCGSIEKKMGLHGSPTCVMNFDGALGHLVGPPHAGMRLMFEMMNRERLATGMMGVGLGEIAYQNALAYARDRRQGRDLKGVRDPEEAADNILVHPDVRRMLLRCKANNEGSRALGVWVGLLLDQMRHAEGAAQQRAADLVALLTPVVKAHLTDLGCEGASECLQVMGGSGYIREFGVEQFMRDGRIAPIWEGTNGIQALDLVGRKIPAHMGRSLREFLWPLIGFIAENRDDPDMAEFTKPLHQGVRGLQQLTMLMMTRGMGDPYFPAAGATEFTRYFGHLVLGSMWARMVKVCLPKRDEDPFYAAKIATARVFFDRVYPETLSLAAKVQAGHRSLMEFPEEML